MFEKGDAVKLINGHSPIMTVMIDNLGFSGVTCVWFDATSNFRTQVVPQDLLKKVEELPR